MEAEANAVELTVDHAWFIAETIAAGAFPWVLAMTMPYHDAAQRGAWASRQAAELSQLGIVSVDGHIDRRVADWVKVVSFPDRWLELRFVGPQRDTGATDLLRGVVAGRAAITDKTVIALRNAQLITFTAMDIREPQALVGVLGAGLAHRPPARFAQFSLPMRVGARADERLRAGAPLGDVLDYLDIPSSARALVESVFTGPRSYVEIVAGCHHDGSHATTAVGMSIVDTTQGRVLVSPSRAFDGEWVSTFSPGTSAAIAAAMEQFTAGLPAGQWFPSRPRCRDFVGQS